MTLRRLLLAAALVGIIVLAVAGYRWLSAPDATTLTGPDTPGPVILIPGYGGGSASLSGLADHLRAQGRDVVVADIADGHGDIDGYGAMVAALAQDAVAQGATSVDLVGYSMGGLVARSAAARAPGIIRRVATVGSPHAGTGEAGLGAFLGNDTACPTACRQMAPGSDFLDALPIAAPADRWLSAWSAGDDVIRPPDSSTLPGATDVEVVSACGTDQLTHGGVIAAPVVWELVSGFLTTGSVSDACTG